MDITPHARFDRRSSKVSLGARLGTWLKLAPVFALVSILAQAQTTTWLGTTGNNTWNRGANWSLNSNTTATNIAVFDNTGTGLAPTIGTTNTTVGSISFASGTTNAYTITGGNATRSLTVGSATTAGITNSSGTNQTFSVTNIILGVSQTWSAASAGNLAFTGNVTLGSNALTLSGSNTGVGSISGIISGTGGLAKSGTGTWMLSGVNTYTGVTSINAGTLSVATIGNGGVAGNLGKAAATASNIVLGGGNLQYTGATATTNRSFTLTAGTTSSIEVTNAGNTLTISGASAATTGGLTKLGAGTLLLSGSNLYTGTTTVTAGTLQEGKANALGSGGITVNGGTLNLATFNDTAGAVSLQSGNINGSGGVLTGTSYDMQSGSVSAILGGGTGVALTKSTTGTVTLSGTNTYTGVTSINAGTLSVATIGNGGVAGNLGQAAAAASNLVLDGGNLQYTGGTATTNRSFTLAAGTTSSIEVTNAANTLTISGASATTTGNLTKLGAGTLLLSGANTFTGATLVSAGTLKAGVASATGSGAFGNNSAVTLANVAGATLDITGFNTQIGSLTGGGATGGNVTLGSATLTVGGDGTSPAAFAGVISGATGNLTKIGAGTLTLSGNNTYAGTTTVSAGTLIASSNNTNNTALGTSAVTLAGGTLELTDDNGFNFGRNVTVNTTSTIMSDRITAGAAVANFTNTLGTLSIGAQTLNIVEGTNTTSGTSGITFSGATTLSATGATFAVGTNATLALGAITGSGNSFTVNGAGSTTVSGVIGTGLGGVTQAGPGALVLGGVNTQTGTTTLTTGTLTVNSGAALSGATAPLVVNGGTLKLNNAAQTVASLNGSGGTINLAPATLTINDTSTDSFAGTFAGAGALVKSGAGTLTLSGNSSSFTGTTTLSAGTLGLANTGALGAAGNALTLNGGTLDLNTDLSVNAYNTTVGGTTTILSDRATSGTGITHTLGTLSIGAQTLNVGAGTNVTSGTAGVTFSATTLSASGATFAPGAGSLLTLGAVGGSGNSFTVNGAGNATITGVIGTGSGGVTKAGAGTLTLSNAANTYTGVTTINGGILSAGTLANGGANSSLGTSSNAAANLILNGGTLQYTGGTVSTNRLFSVGTSGGTLDAGAGGGTLTFNNTGSLGLSGSGTRTLTLAGTNDGSLAAIIGDNAGATSLTKSGSDTWTLAGANTYTGTTTLSAGNLTVNSGAAIGGATSNLVVNGGTLNLNNAAQTVATLNGTGGTINLGYGAGQNLTVNGTANSTWTGNMALTAVGNATLTTGTNLVVIGDGLTYNNTLSLNANTLTFNTVGSPLNTPTYLKLPTGYYLDPTNVYVNSAISGTGGITKTGTGTLTLYPGSVGSSFTGNLTIQQGKVIVDSDNLNIPAVSSNNIIIGNAGSTSAADSVTLQMGQLAHGQLSSSNILGIYNATTAATPTNLFIYEDGVLNMNGGGNGFANLTLQGGHVDGGNATTSSLLTVVSGITTLTSNRTATINHGDLSMNPDGADNFTFSVAPSSVGSGTGGVDLVVGDVVQNGLGLTGSGAAATNLVKTGYGTLVLSGVNQYGGNTLVAQGILNIQNNLALGANGGALGNTTNGTIVSSGAQLQLQGGITVGNATVPGDTLTLNGLGYSSNGTNNDNTGALLNFSGSNTYSGAILIASASRINSTTGNTLYITNPSAGGLNATIIDGTGGIQSLTFGGAGNIVVNGGIANAIGNITKVDSGTLNLAGNNTYSGTLNITTGNVVVTHNNGLSGTVNVTSTGSLQFAKTPGGADLIETAVNTNIQGRGVSGAGAIENLNGNNSFAGAITLGSAATIGADSGTTLTLTGGIANLVPATHNALTVLGNIVENGAIKSGTVTTATGYQSGLTVLTGNGTSGTLMVGTATVAGNLTLGNGKNSIIDGITLVNGSLTATGAGTLVQSGPLSSSNANNSLTINSGATVMAYYGSGTTTFDGTMTTTAGTGTFQKDGPGTLVFEQSFGNSNLNLNISGGTLELYNAISAVNLTFGTIHFVNSSTVLNGQTFITLDFGSVGSYLTTLSSANLIIDQGVSITVQNWASETDFWLATGAFYQGTTNLPAVQNAIGAAPENQITFANWGSGSTTWVGASNPWSDRPNEIRPVPEPATYGALFLSGCLVLFGWRRYSRRASA